ncbi:flagellin [Desulfatibacillum alkenivorans DSM 16219]|jgi:flagellin|uniref:Flagellin n=1 Tax=Desulfatibacillum alkenivorans DSM 16219 TaxID=1121393 RepID=A0A1M6Y6K7_9BACT|nr:flagellin [Desulfatibacillum alkenivorans]SHL13847.1 flagellin [Desulfatibacillum alkenivorans DSM 16219]
MGLRVANNISAIGAHRQLGITDSKVSKSLERLSSGLRINRAKDDAAGLSMSRKFAAQVKSQAVAANNTTQANSLLQIAEGGVEQIDSILVRLKELATQASSKNNEQNLSDLNAEADQLLKEMDRIATTTTFQGSSLLTGYGTKGLVSADATSVGKISNVYELDVSAFKGKDEETIGFTSAGASVITMVYTGNGTVETQTLTVGSGGDTYDFNTFGVSFKTTTAADSAVLATSAVECGEVMTMSVADATFQVGEKNTGDYRISFQLDSMDSTGLSVGAVDLSSLADAQSSMDLIDNAMTALNSSRADIGAIQNRLDYTYANLNIAIENNTAAMSVIQDVDMAAEMTSFTKNQILMQSGTAMLAQANSAPQTVLQLIG